MLRFVRLFRKRRLLLDYGYRAFVGCSRLVNEHFRAPDSEVVCQTYKVLFW